MVCPRKFRQWASASFRKVCPVSETKRDQLHVSPYHPASNRAADLPVQTTKVALAKQVLDVKQVNSISLEHRLANFLILYRSTHHTVTVQSPAKLFLARQIRNYFTLLKLNLSKAVEEQQMKQKKHHDEGRLTFREFKLNDLVLVRNWRNGVQRCIPGRITQAKGPRTYLVRCGNHASSLPSCQINQSISIKSILF